MAADERELVLAGLAGDAGARADAIHRVHTFELCDADVLRAMLRACRDEAVAPDHWQPAVESDPFAGFFGGKGAAAVTIAQLAHERLDAIGWPGLPEVARIAAEVIAEAPPGDHLLAAVVNGLGATTWDDAQGAFEVLVPALHAAEAQMYPAIIRTDAAGVAIMVRSALAPLRSRAMNELLANAQSHQPMLDALCDAVTTRALEPNELQAMAILAQIVAWAGDRAPAIAASLEDRHPWAVVFAALDDAAARERMRSWLASGPAIPAALPERLDEALKSRTAIADYPLQEWLAACDGSCAAIDAWGAADRCVDTLRRWVDRADARAVDAAILLVNIGAHGPSEGAIAQRLADPALSEAWNADRLLAVARARPAVAGVAEVLAARLAADPRDAKTVIPALLAAEAAPSVLRIALEGAIAHAEAAPIKRTPARRGGTQVVRDGTDVPALRPLAEAVADPALNARLEAVLPYLGA